MVSFPQGDKGNWNVALVGTYIFTCFSGDILNGRTFCIWTIEEEGGYSDLYFKVASLFYNWAI